MCKGRYWKQMGLDKKEKQSGKLNALIILSKLLKYPKDVEPQLVIKLLLNLLCIVSP
jgi:hypothetical protein